MKDGSVARRIPGMAGSRRISNLLSSLLAVAAVLVLSVCGGGGKQADNQGGATPQTTANSAPTAVGVVSGNAQAVVSWTAAAGAISYNVYYSSTSGVTAANGTKVANATSGGAITGLANGATYYFVVTAVYAGGESPASAQVTATPGLPAPTAVGVVSGNAQAVVSWTAAAGAISYNVYYSSTSGVTAANGTKVANATSGGAITGLANGATYYFVVTAVYAGGESPASAQVTATPFSLGVWTTKTPMVYQRDNAVNVVINSIIYVIGGAPAGVGILDSMEAYNPATDTWTTKATMPAWSAIPSVPSWAASAAATPPAYRYGPAAAAVNGLIYLIGGTSLVNGQGPIYPIAVYDPSTNSWSSKVPVTAATTAAGTAGQALADAPTGRWGFDAVMVDGLIYAIGGALQVPGGITKANWSSNKGTKVANATSGAAITGLKNGKSYYFFVTAVDAAGVEGAASSAVSVTPQASYAAGTIPANLGTAAGSGQATINWTAVTGATAYNVYYGAKPGVTTSSLTKAAVIGATTATITGLTNNTTYYFIVTAVTGAGETEASIEVSATPQAVSAPSGVSVTGGDRQAAVSWTAVVNAASYNVYYGVDISLYYGNVEVYDPVLNTWATKLAMPTPRYGMSVAVVNGLIYAIGGWGGWPELSKVEVYNPSANTWSITVPVNAATTAQGTAGAGLFPMPTARDDFSYAVMNGVIYAMGGDIGAFNDYARITCCTTTVEAYDTVTNTWSVKAAMPTIRDDFDASVVDGVIYAIAGSRDGQFTANPTPPAGSPIAAVLDPVWLAAHDGGFSLTTVEAFRISDVPVPGGVTATSGANQVSLKWRAVTGATSYNIYWSNKAGVSTTGNSAKIGNGTSIAYTHTGLTAGTWYYYVVTAVTASGESLPSNEAAIKP